MNPIIPGDEIIHPTFGKGQVISVANYLEVYFETAGTKLFPLSWVLDNCTVVKKSEKGKGDIKKTPEQMKLEREIDEIITNFDDFMLSPISIRELKDFFLFKANYAKGHKCALRYNLLLQCESVDESKRFLREIEKGLKQLNTVPKKYLVVSENSLSEELPQDFPLECSVLAIHSCKGIGKDSVAIVSSSVRADLQLKRENKKILWSNIVNFANLKPDCTIIAAGPKEFVDYIRERDDLYYRFFAHRLILRPMTQEEILQSLMDGIKNEGLKVDQEFCDEITKYIHKIYPTADLKDTAFVKDLLNRVLVSYYLLPSEGIVGKRCVPFYRKPRTFDEICEQLNKLVGLQKVKREFRNLYKLSTDVSNQNKQRLHFAFVGNPGTGKTTVANLTAELLFSMGLIKRNKIVTVTPTDIISIYVGESAQLMQEKIREAQGGVLFIDEAYFLISKTSDAKSHQKQCLEVLLQEMEKNSDNLSVIFAGYEDEINQLLDSNPGLKSRVPYRFKFDDYSVDEMMQIFLGLAENEKMALSQDAYDTMRERLELAKTEENFGNARTVANIYQQLKALWIEQNREQRIFTVEDIRATMPVAIDANLDSMIGLGSVKQELKIFESRIKYIKFLASKSVNAPVPNMHMLFTGNPGTGKTTVAKKIADCLYQIGILKTNKLVVAERKDLIDNFVGGTASKTNELIRKAMNGVLFIDEAYSLYKPDDSKDFGTEAIATLITAMEENKDKLVVIFAGYRDEMQIFQSANPGISSRIGFTFQFPDYSPDELTQMFYVKMIKQGFFVDPEAEPSIRKVMEYFSAMENFGNGRFVDKVIDITISNRSFRPYTKRFNDILAKDIPQINDLIRVSSNGHNLYTSDDQSEEKRKRIAVHEIGHAIVSKALDPSRKIVRITINADANSAGKAVVDINQDSMTESRMKAVLAALFGGRNAERLIFNEHSAGCSSDMSQAKKLAKHMVEDLAVGDFGVTTSSDLLQEADSVAAKILKEKEAVVRRLSDLLFEKGILEGEQLEQLMENA